MTLKKRKFWHLFQFFLKAGHAYSDKHHMLNEIKVRAVNQKAVPQQAPVKQELENSGDDISPYVYQQTTLNIALQFLTYIFEQIKSVILAIISFTLLIAWSVKNETRVNGKVHSITTDIHSTDEIPGTQSKQGNHLCTPAFPQKTRHPAKIMMDEPAMLWVGNKIDDIQQVPEPRYGQSVITVSVGCHIAGKAKLRITGL